MLRKQFKITKNLVIYAIVGWLMLITLNIFGHRFGFYLPVNFATITLSGVLGVPGVILMLVLKSLLV